MNGANDWVSAVRGEIPRAFVSKCLYNSGFTYCLFWFCALPLMAT